MARHYKAPKYGGPATGRPTLARGYGFGVGPNRPVHPLGKTLGGPKVVRDDGRPTPRQAEVANALREAREASATGAYGQVRGTGKDFAGPKPQPNPTPPGKAPDFGKVYDEPFKAKERGSDEAKTFRKDRRSVVKDLLKDSKGGREGYRKAVYGEGGRPEQSLAYTQNLIRADKKMLKSEEITPEQRESFETQLAELKALRDPLLEKRRAYLQMLYRKGRGRKQARGSTQG